MRNLLIAVGLGCVACGGGAANVDTATARRELGWRPIYPSVYTARDAGAL